MSATVTLLVLLAATFHALWNALGKKSADTLVSIAGIALSCGVFAATLFPFVGWPEPMAWRWIGVSICIHTAYMVMLSQAYHYGDFSLAYPVARGVAPVLVLGFSLLILDEVLQPRQFIAIGGILLGILLFATRSLGQGAVAGRSLVYAILTAVLISAYTLVDGVGVRSSGSTLNYIAWVFFLQAFPIFGYMVYQRGFTGIQRLRAEWRTLLLAGLFSIASYGIVLWAMTVAPIALVAALRETSIIIAALIGLFWLRERGGSRHLMAALVIFLSVVYLKW